MELSGGENGWEQLCQMTGPEELEWALPSPRTPPGPSPPGAQGRRQHSGVPAFIGAPGSIPPAQRLTPRVSRGAKRPSNSWPSTAQHQADSSSGPASSASVVQQAAGLPSGHLASGLPPLERGRPVCSLHTPGPLPWVSQCSGKIRLCPAGSGGWVSVTLSSLQCPRP